MLTNFVQMNKILLHLALGLGGSLLILGGIYYVSRHAGHDIDPAALLEAIQAGSIGLFLVYALMTLLGILLRAWRYQVLLIASGEGRLPGFRDLALITAVRNMTVDLLPARLGELVFVGLLRQRAGTQVASGLSALLFATLMDILILAPFTVVIGLVVGFPNRQPYLLAIIAFLVVIVFVLAIRYLAPFFSKYFIAWSSSSNRALSRLSAFIESIIEAVDTTMKAGVFGRVIGLTVLVRVSKYTGLLCLFYGLAGGSFPELAELQAFKVLGAMIASEMTASLPIPALMSFGSWELGGMTLLAWFGAPPNHALMVMLGTHIQTQAMDYGLGIAALLALVLFNNRIRNQQGRGFGWRQIVAAIFVVAALAMAWFAVSTGPGSVPVKPVAVQQIQRPPDQPLPGWVKELDGTIVWSSNRAGNHDIWLMNLPEMNIRPLTDDPHTENFARISPDGRKVVFARSHKAWQSLRDETPWDIWMIDIASGREEKLAEWGFSPDWSADGSFITFQRNPGKIMALDMKSRKERIYYESGKDHFMKSRLDMLTPSTGKGGKLAFTFRDFGQPVNIIRDEAGEFTVVQRDSCQVRWAPRSEYATYVGHGGKQKNQIMRFDTTTGAKTSLLDLPGNFSHEYFPHLSHDEQFMVLAASDGGHEHDLANYELFLWPLHARSDAALRLTFNQVNDSWPSIWLRQD